jgi:hypothetical protein
MEQAQSSMDDRRISTHPVFVAIKPRMPSADYSAPETPEAYISSLPEDRRAALTTLHRAIRAAVPKLEPAMISGIIGYGKFHYKYATGREGDWFIIGLCSRAAHISLYICAAENGAYLAEKNAAKLGKAKVGKSCITFKKLEHLNLDAAMSLVKRAEKLGGAGAMI